MGIPSSHHLRGRRHSRAHQLSRAVAGGPPFSGLMVLASSWASCVRRLCSKSTTAGAVKLDRGQSEVPGPMLTYRHEVRSAATACSCERTTRSGDGRTGLECECASCVLPDRKCAGCLCADRGCLPDAAAGTGAQGPEGPPGGAGPPGPPGPGGPVTAINVTTAKQIAATISSVTIPVAPAAAQPVIKFTIVNEVGVPLSGLQASQLGFAVARLVPPGHSSPPVPPQTAAPAPADLEPVAVLHLRERESCRGHCASRVAVVGHGAAAAGDG